MDNNIREDISNQNRDRSLQQNITYSINEYRPTQTDHGQQQPTDQGQKIQRNNPSKQLEGGPIGRRTKEDNMLMKTKDLEQTHNERDRRLMKDDVINTKEANLEEDAVNGLELRNLILSDPKIKDLFQNRDDEIKLIESTNVKEILNNQSIKKQPLVYLVSIEHEDCDDIYHMCLLISYKKLYIYFDSNGDKPPKWLTNVVPEIECFSEEQYQDPGLNTCAKFCFAFMKFLSEGKTLEEIRKIMDGWHDPEREVKKIFESARCQNYDALFTDQSDFSNSYSKYSFCKLM